MGTQDLKIKRPPTIASLPSGSQSLRLVFTMGAGTQQGFQVTYHPDSSILSLWNFLFSAFIDTDDPSYNWPTGSNLTSAVWTKFLAIERIDWADSSDTSNVRNVKYLLQNNDTSTHTIYFYSKGYPIAAAAAHS